MKPLLLKSARYLATAAWAAAGVWLIGLTFTELKAVWLVPPTPPEVSHDLIIRNAKDDSGRSTSFRILLFTDEFRWVINSFDALEKTGERPHFTDEMKAVLNSAKEIIAVGTSSEEIPVGTPLEKGRELEEKRAARRAEQIALWVREALGKPIPVRKLNVGHHKPTGADDTSDQRRVVIILVLDHDKDADIDQSLRQAMAGESERAPIFQALLTKYSLGSGASFTWVP
jgi:hypothetical protein